VPAEGRDVSAAVEAILLEAEHRAPREPHTLFVGGGTPSLLSVAQLTHFLDRLDEISGFRNSAVEVTLECNPESLDFDKARALLDLGVGRLSIGFQSLQSSTLELFGRVHDVDQSFRAYDAARAAGVGDINIDMIFAAPGQQAPEWRTSLTRVLDLEPDHLSAYNLAFEEETLFARWLRTGKVKALPEEVELEFLEITLELTDKHGFGRYEISNYARPGRECRHNLNYWSNGSYLGLGPSAVSYADFRRAGNVREILTYQQAIADRHEAEDWSETLRPEARLGETWWLGLRRMQGVAPEEARRTAGYSAEPDPPTETATTLVGEGLLEFVDGRYKLSSKGLPLADRIAAEFLLPAEE